MKACKSCEYYKGCSHGNGKRFRYPPILVNFQTVIRPVVDCGTIACGGFKHRKSN